MFIPARDFRIARFQIHCSAIATKETTDQQNQLSTIWPSPMMPDHTLSPTWRRPSASPAASIVARVRWTKAAGASGANVVWSLWGVGLRRRRLLCDVAPASSSTVDTGGAAGTQMISLNIALSVTNSRR